MQRPWPRSYGRLYQTAAGPAISWLDRRSAAVEAAHDADISVGDDYVGWRLEPHRMRHVGHEVVAVVQDGIPHIGVLLRRRDGAQKRPVLLRSKPAAIRIDDREIHAFPAGLD